MSALNQFVTASATSYLQSVVFVDDHIYGKYDGKPIEPAITDIPSSPRPSFFSTHEEGIDSNEYRDPAEVAMEHSPETTTTAPSPAETADDPIQIDGNYHPRELMESFARKGIVCALCEPREQFTTDPDSDLFRLCERADVVILDWDLHNDDGDGVCCLLAELIKKSQSELPHHVRLCAIYTSQISLHRILSRLLEELSKKGVSVEVEEGALRLVAEATKIAVFGKPPEASRVEDERIYEVAERDLADRIVEEFAGLHRGILPAFALHGLASIRRNTKRLLDKFRSELDGAFLLHRALALSDREAFEELPGLLSDELLAVLEDMWPGSVPIKEVVASAVAELTISQPEPQWRRKTEPGQQEQPYDVQPAIRDMLIKGEEALKTISKECIEAREIKESTLRGIKVKRLTDFESMFLVNGKSWSEPLGALFSNRTQYGSEERYLRFGTIVRHKVRPVDPWNYSLCLMPICDSKRLKPNSQFPFWRLTEDTKSGNSGRRFGIVVEEGEKSLALAAGGKIRDMLWIAKFTQTDKEVIGTHGGGGVFRFDSPDLIVEWAAELKPLHAQRVASHLGSEVSKVGLVESEWLRLFCDR